MPTALVTGAAKRLGKSMSVALAKQGYNIIIHCCRSTVEAVEVKKEIEALGCQAWVVFADLSVDNLSSFFTELYQLQQPISLVVNSASLFLSSDFLNQDLDFLDRHWNVNCRAPYAICQWFVNNFKFGHIVNITDCNQYNKAYFPYMLSKNALTSLSKMMAKTLAPKFRVNSIAPGWILNPSDQDNFDESQMRTLVPLQARGEATDVCNALIYLDENQYITGQTIYIDGGKHL